MAKAYKPKPNELILDDDLKNHLEQYLPRIKPRILNISGELNKVFNEYMKSGLLIDTERKYEKYTGDMAHAFSRMCSRYIVSRKKQYFLTGVNNGKLQVLLFNTVIPVPHLKSLMLVVGRIVISAKDIGMVHQTTMFDLMCDDDLPEEQRIHYENCLRNSPKLGDTLAERTTNLIFDIIPYPGVLLNAA